MTGRPAPPVQASPGQASWVDAWTGGHRGAHLGNVAEFNLQFLPARSGASRRRWLADGHRYADLAMFYSPHPQVVILPGDIHPEWIDMQRRALEWDPVEVYTGVAGGAELSADVLARPALLTRLADHPGPLLAWGRTPAFDRLDRAIRPRDGARFGAALRAVRRFESKAAANDLFRRAAAGVTGVAVPSQRHYDTLAPAALAAARSARAGRPVVLKSVHGVGGAGTHIVTAARVTAAGGPRAWRRRVLAATGELADGPSIVEQYVAGAGPCRDLTVDVLITDAGAVHLVGVGEMHIEGTRYAGVAVGPGAVPARLERVASGFAPRVAGALADAGYRGWFDIDLVAAADGTLWPTEINCRLTGPTVAFSIAARLDRVRGARHLVRTLDRLALGVCLPDEVLLEHARRAGRACAALGVVLIPTLVSAGYDPRPSIGLALAATDRSALDLATTVVRGATDELVRFGAAPGRAGRSGRLVRAAYS